MGFRVDIVSDDCMSSGRCVAEQPAAFGFDDEELAVVLPGAASLDDAALLRLARSCPSMAIVLFDGDDQVRL